ncbi:MAG: hypothetical protein EZS28_031622 [Streblomastix strix]|uniref:Uncharacterized protein n=1 Tax=Streblomastix strix TaxID=222440 RepID=A0A5J4US24_9EUKA|nr:MAG: hypothetical protein EZS28_031622 [Streblomastix strix]
MQFGVQGKSFQSTPPPVAPKSQVNLKKSVTQLIPSIQGDTSKPVTQSIPKVQPKIIKPATPKAQPNITKTKAKIKISSVYSKKKS